MVQKGQFGSLEGAREGIEVGLGLRLVVGWFLTRMAM